MTPLTLSQVQSTISSFQKLISLEKNPARAFNNAELAEMVSLTIQRFVELDRADQFTTLAKRLTQGSIGTAEMADFIATSPMPYAQTLAALRRGTSALQTIGYFDKLDFYLNKNFSASVAGDFFSAFNGALQKLTEMQSAAAQTIEQLQNGPTGSLPEVKDILFSVVDGLAPQMTSRLNGILATAAAAEGRSVAAFNLIQNRVQMAQELFSPASVDAIKSQVEARVAQMAGQYEILNKPITDYITFRYTQLTDTLSSSLQQPVDATSQLVQRMDSSHRVLSNYSSMARADNVQLGGFRVDPNYARAARAQISGSVNAGSSGGVVGSTPTPTRYVRRPFTEQDQARVATLTQNGNEFISFQPQVQNQNDPVPGAGWKHVKPEVYMTIFRVAERLGHRFSINSAYRSPAYNAGLDGAAKNSLHMSGLALDVSMSGVDRNEFIKVASQEGFGGIGSYSSFIHVDLGQRRTWGSGDSEARRIHTNNGFANG